MVVMLLAVCIWAPAQELEREGPFEKLVLLRGADADSWSEAEATMTPDTTRVKTADASHHFHIDVDFNAGEKAYPIGWPRTNVALKQPWQQDWTGFDFLRFWVYTKTSRDALPSAPLGIVLHTPTRASSHHDTVLGLKQDEWVEVRIPLSKIANHDQVTLFQFFIAESNYRDHDVVDFHIDDICLLRYAEPHVIDATMRPPVVFSDAAAFVMRLQLSGIAEGEHVKATVSLEQDGQTLTTVARDVTRGTNDIVVNLSGSDLPVGDYRLKASLAGGDSRDFELKVIESPWAE